MLQRVEEIGRVRSLGHSSPSPSRRLRNLGLGLRFWLERRP